MAMVLKTIVAATSPWVRIPRPPLLPRKTDLDLGLYSLSRRTGLVTDRSQMQPTAAICRWSRDIRGMKLEAFPQVNQRKTDGPGRKRDPYIVGRSGDKCFSDRPVSGLLAAVEALRVNPQQHLQAVTSTIADLEGPGSVPVRRPSPRVPAVPSGHTGHIARHPVFRPFGEPVVGPFIEYPRTRIGWPHPHRPGTRP
jgi:hypothetical protein